MKITTNTCPENTPPPIEDFFSTPCTWSGLSCRLHAGKGERIVLVDLDQLCEDEAVMLLSAAELEFFQRFRYPKRRREWLGGRIAAKAALLTLHEPKEFQRQARVVTVLPDEYGKPIVSGLADNSLSLSITHSSNYAAAFVVHGKNCGIDLQEISDKLPALTGYFASAAELELLPDLGDQATTLTMLWAVKEAVKKSLLHSQPRIFAGIAVEQVTPVGKEVWRFDCVVQDSTAQSVMAYQFSPYVLALTIPL